MNYDELLEMLQIETPGEFEYFENLADIMECEERIGEEALEKLLSQVDLAVLEELVSNYFSEMLDNVPAHETDLYMLLQTIGMSLVGLVRESAKESGKVSLLSEELNRFRDWYMLDTEVPCRSLDDGSSETVPLAEAIAICSLEALTGDKYECDFETCLTYPLTEYIMSLADIAASDNVTFDHDDGEHDSEHYHAHNREHDHGHAHVHDRLYRNGPHIHMEEGKAYGHASSDILNDGFVYDDLSHGDDDTDDLF